MMQAPGAARRTAEEDGREKVQGVMEEEQLRADGECKNTVYLYLKVVPAGMCGSSEISVILRQAEVVA